MFAFELKEKETIAIYSKMMTADNDARQCRLNNGRIA